MTWRSNSDNQASTENSVDERSGRWRESCVISVVVVLPSGVGIFFFRLFISFGTTVGTKHKDRQQKSDCTKLVEEGDERETIAGGLLSVRRGRGAAN